MAGQGDLTRLTLDAVVTGCRAESQRSRQLEVGYCFELFRRALERADHAAWAMVAAQYHRLILEWVHAARRPTDLRDDPEELAREVIARFWRTLAGRCTPLVARFPHVGALLKYLQQCAITTVLDRRRSAVRYARIDAMAAVGMPVGGTTPGPEDEIIEQTDRAALLAQVRAWVASAVADPAEQLVLRLSYTDDLSPTEIAARYPDRFADAAIVRQIKERVLRRARRALLDGDSDAGGALSK